MKCPVCTSHNLLISERQGIEIDYCPQCRGVWLDRGELDKLIERSAASQSNAAVPMPAARPAMHTPPPPAYDARFGHGGHGYEYKRKKKGFLGEIFDFD
ncbi:zf-TFIIB domain-containing protein [Herbaspirillum sp. DW155]|uniref:TFIIB-type zinc ribbon-containing protein n=1 Tax=Herbaspirillum sp. DW155 TaxID=3095609 RepID=UPI00308EE2A0|nr:zf-TFIIB domain-containing protein [Herbaspirillum sp. DW155]